MVNAYDFDSDNEVNNDLSDIGKQLSQVNKSKDSLIKLLKVNRNVSSICSGHVEILTAACLVASWRRSRKDFSNGQWCQVSLKSCRQGSCEQVNLGPQRQGMYRTLQFLFAARE